MKETVVDSILSQELDYGRIVTAKVHKECSEAEGDGVHQITIKLYFTVSGNYDDAKLEVLKYFSKLKLDTSNLMLTSDGDPVAFDVKNPGSYIKIGGGNYEPIVTTVKPVKRKAGWPKGKPRGPRKTKADVTTNDLLDKAEQKKSRKLNADFFMNLPNDNVFSQAGS